MYKIFTLLVLSWTLVSCTSEPENNHELLNGSASLNAPKYDRSSIGLYKGVFTTLNAKYRGTVEIRIPPSSDRNNTIIYPSASLFLQNGTEIELKGQEIVEDGEEIVDLEFLGSKAGFLLSVDSNGNTVVVSDAVYLGMEAGITALKETSQEALAPVSGTWNCTACNVFMTGTDQTFNMITTSAGAVITTQTTLNGTLYDGAGTANNCVGPYLDINRCQVEGNFDPFGNGNYVDWQGTQLSSDITGGYIYFGNWYWPSNSSGLLHGTFISDGATANFVGSSLLYFEEFQDFLGNGFSPSPLAGQLNSNIWIAGGVSDGDVEYGSTAISGDHARGISEGGETTGGIYAFDFAPPATNWTLGAQPTGSDFSEGFFEFRQVNQTGVTLQEHYLSSHLMAFNNADRSSTIQVFYGVSSNGGLPPTFPDEFTLIDSFTTTANANDLVESEYLDASFAAAVAPSEYLHIRYLIDDAGGTGSRDELGMDSIVLLGK